MSLPHIYIGVGANKEVRHEKALINLLYIFPAYCSIYRRKKHYNKGKGKEGFAGRGKERVRYCVAEYKIPCHYYRQ